MRCSHLRQFALSDFHAANLATKEEIAQFGELDSILAGTAMSPLLLILLVALARSQVVYQSSHRPRTSISEAWRSTETHR